MTLGCTLLALLVGCTPPTLVELGTKVFEAPAEPRAWYPDADHDGFGDPAGEVWVAEAPAHHVDNAADCDDADPQVRPNAHEIRDDGIDQDCSGHDATCATLPDITQDLTLLADGADDWAELLCREFAGVRGTIVLQDTSWTSLEPLACLCWIGGMELVDNPRLSDVSLLETLGLHGDPARLVVEGEHALSAVRARVSPTVGEIRFTEAGSLDVVSVTGATHVERLELTYTTVHTLGGLEDVASVDELVVARVPVPQQWDFPALHTVGVLRMDHADLDSLQPFRTVETLGDLDLSNAGIHTFDDLESLTALGHLRLRGYTPVQDLRSLAGLPPLASLQLQAPLDFRSLEGLPAPTRLEWLWVIRTEVADFGPLAGLEVIENDLYVLDSHELHTLEGLEQLREVGGDLYVARNDGLRDVSALHGTKVAGKVYVDGPSLAQEDVDALLAAIAANNQP